MKSGGFQKSETDSFTHSLLEHIKSFHKSMHLSNISFALMMIMMIASDGKNYPAFKATTTKCRTCRGGHGNVCVVVDDVRLLFPCTGCGLGVPWHCLTTGVWGL